MNRTRTLVVASVFAGALVLGGCTVHAGLAIPVGPPVVIAHGHSHSAHCGHYKHRGRWYHAADHHHGRGCGHKLRGGVWVLVR